MIPSAAQVPVLDPLSLGGQAITPAALAASKWVARRACGATGVMQQCAGLQGTIGCTITVCGFRYCKKAMKALPGFAPGEYRYRQFAAHPFSSTHCLVRLVTALQAHGR